MFLLADLTGPPNRDVQGFLRGRGKETAIRVLSKLQERDERHGGKLCGVDAVSRKYLDPRTKSLLAIRTRPAIICSGTNTFYLNACRTVLYDLHIRGGHLQRAVLMPGRR